jgi:hypothetical protein
MALSTARALSGGRLARLLACLSIAFALLFAALAGGPAERASAAGKASQSRVVKKHSAKHRKASKAKRYRQRSRAQRRRAVRARRARSRRLRRANRKLGVASHAAVSRPRKAAGSVSTAPSVLDAGFERGLLNWNTAGVGEVLPTLANDIVRSGGWSGRVALSGGQNRSELILGGTGGGSTSGMVEFHEGDEYWYGFSFYVVSMVYGEPGAHNLIMQFKGDDSGSPAFGLGLWDYEGDDGEYEDNPKGLWSHGDAMDGDRFLAPLTEGAWHDVGIHFRASGAGAGFYEVYLDGALVDSRSGVSMIAPGASYAYIKNGLYRDGSDLYGNAEIRLDAAKLGHSWAEVAAG